MTNQLPIYPAFKANGFGRLFSTLQEAAEVAGNLTLNRGYEIRKRIEIGKPEHQPTVAGFRRKAEILKATGTFSRKTLFLEVQAVCPPLSGAVLDLVRKGPERRRINIPGLVEKLRAVLLSFLEEKWDDSRLYVFAHSSGYDSRLISAALRFMGKRNVWFICHKPEHEDFIRIMDWMGWENWLAVDEYMDDVGYYDDMLDFKVVGRECSDVNRMALYCDSFVLRRTVGIFEKGIGQKATVVTGLYGNETFAKDIYYDDFAFFVVAYLHDVHLDFRSCEIMTPYVSVPWCEVMLKHRIPQNEQKEVKMAVAESFMEGISRLHKFEDPRLMARVREEMDLHRLSPEAHKKMKDDFRHSWYCHVNGLRDMALPDRLQNAGHEWRHYFKAAICEEMLRRGCEVRVRE